MKTKEEGHVFDRIAAELKKERPNQRKLAALYDEMDRVLGTEMKEEDKAKAEAWERSRR